MMDNSSFEIQNKIRQNAMLNQENIKSLKEWESEMKIKENEFQKPNEDIQSLAEKQKPPIRSKVDEFQQFAKESAQLLKSMSIDEGDDNRNVEERNNEDTKKKQAVDFKDKGNAFVKAKDYESALKMYTRAIDLCQDDPVFYSNRSQCYLSLEKYRDCISDATKAIQLDSKSTKALYRRMNAYEKLGEDYKALQSCRLWLDLAPEDATAKNSYDRIHNRIAEAEKKKDQEKIRWSRPSPSSFQSDFVNRPPHLRSKMSLKSIPVELRKAKSPIPTEIIDRIFDNNTGEASPETNSKLFKSSFLIAPKAEKAVEHVTTNKESQNVNAKKEMFNETNKNLQDSEMKREEMPKLEDLKADKSHLITIPLSGPQFYAAWKELTDIQRFLYLKNIIECNVPIGRLLGAQLNSEILSELIFIVHKFFMFYNVPFIQMLSDLRTNTEISMLVMFLEEDEKQKLNELLSSTSSNGDNATNILVQEIKNFFQV